MFFSGIGCVLPDKAVVSMPVGGPAVMNNYMIAQPPGFQLATFVSAVHALHLWWLLLFAGIVMQAWWQTLVQ